MGHREIIEHIESWPGANSPANNAVEALTAIYHLLDERLPEKPMQVISTPPAPEDRPATFDPVLVICTQDSRRQDRLYVKQDADGEFVFNSTHGSMETSIYVSAKSARRLAKAILASTTENEEED